MDTTENVLTIGSVSSFESVTARYFLRSTAGHASERLKNSELLVYVLRGTVEFRDAVSAVRVRANELLVLSGTNGRELSCEFCSDSEWYTVRFHQPKQTRFSALSPSEPFVHLRVARPERLTALLRHCIDNQRRKPQSGFAAAHFLRLIIAEVNLSRAESEETQDGQGVFEVITSRVDAYIAAHYHEPISTVEIAHEIRYNPEYLERAYRQIRQLSIREAILERRVKEARAQLLLQKNRSVSDIAVVCGFNDLSYFRRVFKKMTNMTPHRYRSTRRSARESATLDHGQAVGAALLRRDPTRIDGAPSRSLRENQAPPLFALNAGFFVSSGHGTHARRMIDSYELIFVTDGCLELFEDEAVYHVRKNQSLLLEPGRVHGGLSPFPPDLNFYWIHFRVHEPSLGGPMICIPKTTQVPDPELLTELFCMFITDQESQKLTKESAANLVALMLSVIGQTKDTPVRKHVRGKPSVLARSIEKFIDENYDKPISTRTIARALQFSPDYLERVQREHGGTSIVHALHERRIRAAREHLRNRISKNINEIAFACGYNDSGYFRRVFKRATGLTPKQYRSMFVQTHINTH